MSCSQLKFLAAILTTILADPQFVFFSIFLQFILGVQINDRVIANQLLGCHLGRHLGHYLDFLIF